MPSRSGRGSAWLSRWRTPAALVGALCFGLAGLRHLVVGGAFTELRMIAMASDLFIAVVPAACLVTVAVRCRRAQP